MASSLSSKIKFNWLCGLFDRISKAKSAEKYDKLREFTYKCRKLASEIKADRPEADTSLFPVYRLIMPTLERDRGPYGLKTKSLSLLYVRVFCLGKESHNARILTDYRKPETSKCTNDDFADRVHSILRNRLPAASSDSLTIEAVNNFLDELAKCSENNKSRDEMFRHFIHRTKVSADDLKWLTRILLKDLRLNLQQKRVFEVLHPDAEKMFNVTSSLKRVCDHYSVVGQNSDDGHNLEVELFAHVKPMLLERLKWERVGKLFKDQPAKYFVQTKFDGERSQIHVRDGQFKYFTRQGYDITQKPMYGESKESAGFVTRNIAELLAPDCRSCILDGEMMGWHKERGRFGTKGQNFDVKNLLETSKHQPCFVAYDVLVYNGASLMNKPYSERLEYLSKAFTDREGVMQHCETSTVTNEQELHRLFNEALDRDEEGIVIKRHDARYSPNVREKSGCFKLKAEYSDKLVQDLDLIILGGEYGQGRHSGIISSFVVGAAGPTQSSSGGDKAATPSEFYQVGSVSSGLSDEDLRTLQEKLRDHWKDRRPAGIVPAKNSNTIAKWVSPKNSIILQLRASELQPTARFPLGLTLRFPRVMKVRHDKPWYDACSAAELKRIAKEKEEKEHSKTALSKLTKRKAKLEDIEVDNSQEDDGEEREAKPKIRKYQAAAVYDAFAPTVREHEVTRLSRLFGHREICVINGDAELSKRDIELLLTEHMARVVQNPGRDTYCCLVGDPETYKAKTLIASGKYDVVKVDWLRRATRAENIGKLQEFLPWDMLATREATKARFNETYDEYQDSYTQDIKDEEDLKRIFKNIDDSGDKLELTDEQTKQLDEELFGSDVSPYSVFRGLVGYFDDADACERYSFEFMGGQVAKRFDEQRVQYVFVDDDDEVIPDAYANKDVRILKKSWITDCVEQRKFLPIDDYTPR
ncbi:unnamed protein product [Trichogramma brassicae]|uniref:DNA ligase 4 n=1 Tax=Trichogramma brassicae TaxID=86971 RepID=A0A6H5I5H8_9HYME|nr:unnamed protein product [Trichogramma brassicae]